MPAAPFDPALLAAVIKAYDVRGRVPEQITDELAHAVGAAFVTVGSLDSLVVGHDMRPSSPGLARALAEGAASAGADVTLLGLTSTDQLYFASGTLGRAGAMITASHNPGAYNGIKLCYSEARPVGQDTGLAEIRELIGSGRVEPATTPGTIDRADLLAAYADHLLSLAPVSGRRLKVVADAGNGMAGHTAPAVFERIDTVDLVPMYFELDGTFPNHEANPLDHTTLVDLEARVLAEGADLGLAFDGDADRCFVIDERGELVDPSALTALIAERELAKEPGATIIHNLITSRSVPELVAELGGRPVRTRVGHSFIKATMADTDAIFGGEHSGHFYFRDFWRADSGMLAALHTMAALAEQDRPLSELVADYSRYVPSGEINSEVADPEPVYAAIREEYGGRPGVVLDDLDGWTVQAPDWTFNVRPSNTEPLLRLNVEGKDGPTMARVRDAVLARIRTPQ